MQSVNRISILLLFATLYYIQFRSISSKAFGSISTSLDNSIQSQSEDPKQNVQLFLDKLLNSVGIGTILNGNEESNRRRVDTPVRLRRPPIESAIYYYYYAQTILCESSLERWDCHFCKILGPHIRVVAIHESVKYRTKILITLDPKKREIVLTIRPTYNVANLLIDFHALPCKLDDSNIEIHCGFLLAVLADLDWIVGILKTLTSVHPHHKVIIAGYSHGGELSAVLMFILKYRNLFPWTSFEMYTYGAARSGNKAFADFLNNLTIPVARVVQEDDLIPRVPPASLGYYHHHNELFINDDGLGNRTARYCSIEFYEDPHCAQSYGPSLLITQPLAQVTEHFTIFGIDSSKCLQENPVEFLLQLIWPLKRYIPRELLAELPIFAVNTSLVIEFRNFVKAGISRLISVAGGSDTHRGKKVNNY